MKESTLSSKNEYLHKLFAPMVKELNGQALKNQPFQSALSTEQLSNKNESENKEVIQTNTLNGKILPFQQMSKPYELTLTQSQSGKNVSTDQLIQQFESILSKSQLMTSGGNQKLFIKLYPEHLGALRVELIQKDSTLIAKFMTSTATAKDLLESQIQSLKQAFGLQNIQVERIEISQQLNQQERYFNRDSQQQQEQRQQREQEEQKQQNDQPFTVSFEETLLNVEV
jgi:flagellar hook-length control protein FliK